MKKIEATTLEDAYELAKVHFGCTMAQLDYEIIQYPSNGFLGLGKKQAIILASSKIKKKPEITAEEVKHIEVKPKQEEPSVELEIPKAQETIEDKNIHDCDDIDENMFCNKATVHYEDKECSAAVVPQVVNDDLARAIEDDIFKLFSFSCYHIDVVEVDIVDNNALIFIDGNDVALLIGKDGYRYNAISYMLFNWLFAKYGLFVKLEIASFVTSQEEMIANVLLPLIDKINSDGKGRTRPFKGILIQIALTQLRDAFPSKYVAIKTNKNGDRYIVVNDFNKKIDE